MSSSGQFLSEQFSEAQIEQLIQSRCGMPPVENEILDEDRNVNKENSVVHKNPQR